MSDAKALKDFFSAWGQADPDKRAALVGSAVGDGFIYVDPHAPDPITSVGAFLGYVAQFSEKMPGASATVIEPIDTHHGSARTNVLWDFGGGKQMVGQYFADLDGAGKITRIVGFPGKGAE